MENSEQLFGSLVLSLAASAMQLMGKTVNPVSGKVEVNLEQAQATIDLLDVLQTKTKGNLSDAEDKLLGHILGDLKLNYVETMNAKPGEAAADAPELPKEEAPPAPPPEADNAADGKAAE